MSIRVRLTLWYASTLGALLLVFALGVYYFVQRGLVRQLDRRLDEQVSLVKAAVQDEEPEDLDELSQHDAVPFFEVRETNQPVRRSAGWTRVGLDAVDAPPAPRANWTASTRDDGRYQLRSVVLSAHGQAHTVTVAVSTQPMRRTLATLATILLVGLPLGLGAALGGGYFLAGRVLAPIHAIAAEARKITAERLGERLPVAHAEDEIGQLATVINELLGRLDESFQRLRRFTADASHELRTPLTAIRSVGEVALQNGAEAEPPAESPAGRRCYRYREAIGSMLEETARLALLFEDLLTLTRADENRAVLNAEPTALREVVQEAAEVLHVLTEDKSQKLELSLDEDLAVMADRRTLRQAVLNLLDNAIKYTPADGVIRVVVRRRSDGAAFVEVTDDGPGIAPEHQARVFERFFRVDPSRSRQRGAGLGLAIAQWAVAANGGRIELESEVGRGSTFRIVLPALARERRGRT